MCALYLTLLITVASLARPATGRAQQVDTDPIERAIAADWRASTPGIEARAAGARLAARYYDRTEGERWGARRESVRASALSANMNLGLILDDTIAVKCDGSVSGKCGILGPTGVVAMSPVRVVGDSAFAEIVVFFWTPPSERTAASKPELPNIQGQYVLARDRIGAWHVTHVRWAMK
jgi:hypothetical protein